MAGPSFAGDRSRQQDRCLSFLKLDPPPIQCAARVNSLLTEQSSYNFNSVILFSTFTRLTAYNWRRVQFETTTLAHLLASCVKLETRTSQLAASALSKSSGVWCGCIRHENTVLATGHNSVNRPQQLKCRIAVKSNKSFSFYYISKIILVPYC